MLGVLVLLFSACRTTGHLELAPAVGDLANYQCVVVQGFAVQLVSNEAGAEPRIRATQEAGIAAARLADLVAEYLQRQGAFTEVLRGEPNPPAALIVEGVVTRAVVGDAETRFREGTGLGSAHLEAILKVRDSDTGEVLATMVINRGSWPGGGLFAVDETLDSFLDQEARKFARQLSAALGMDRSVSGTPRLMRRKDK